MRRTSLALMALAFLHTAGAVEAQTLKIAYVNSQEILMQAPGAEEAQAQFEREMQGYQSEIAQLETELQNLQNSLQQQSLTLSPEARANREQQLQQKFQEYQQRAAQLQTVADQRRAELVQPVMDQITQVIEQIREEGAYSLILDAASGAIVSADPVFDLTQQVIARLGTTGAGQGGAR